MNGKGREPWARVNEYGPHRSAYWPPLARSPSAKCCPSTLLTCHAEAREARGVLRNPAEGRESSGRQRGQVMADGSSSLDPSLPTKRGCCSVVPSLRDAGFRAGWSWCGFCRASSGVRPRLVTVYQSLGPLWLSRANIYDWPVTTGFVGGETADVQQPFQSESDNLDSTERHRIINFEHINAEVKGSVCNIWPDLFLYW